MEVLWNQINLQRPPYRSWDVSVKEFDSRKFIDDVDKIVDDFQKFQLLNPEAALLSRLIYRMKSKFRSDKGLKHMEKVNRALLNYLHVSLEKEYKFLKEYIEINNGIVSLPPRQTLEYVLVRTQGFAKLMSRVESTSQAAANFFKSRLYTGQSWTVALIAYAVTSRIWLLARYIIKRSCVWYNTIHNYLKSFKMLGIPWLPDNYNLPENLAQWLDLPWIFEDDERLPMKEDWEQTIFNLIKKSETYQEDDSICNEVIAVNDDTKKGSEKLDLEQNRVTLHESNNDLGERIPRLSFEGISQDEQTTGEVKKEKKYKIKQLKKKSELLNVKSKNDLVHLLQANSIPGLDKLQWNILRKRIKKLLMKLTKNNTCNLNKQSLRKVAQYIQKWTSA